MSKKIVSDDTLKVKSNPLKVSAKETAERLKWALALAAKGLGILELQPGKKVPVGGVAWGLRATTDPDKLRTMFRENPAMNYGVNPGRNRALFRTGH